MDYPRDNATMRATAGMLVLRLFVVVPACGRLCYPAMVKDRKARRCFLWRLMPG